MGVTSGGTQLTNRTQSSTRKPKRVIAEDGLCSAVVVLVLYLVDELTDVDSCGACFLARAIGALHASVGLCHGFLFCVNSVVVPTCPVLLEVSVTSLDLVLVLSPLVFSVGGRLNIRCSIHRCGVEHWLKFVSEFSNVQPIVDPLDKCSPFK